MAKKPLRRTPEEQRSYTMSRIKSSNTGIEATLTKALWREGIRYRRNYKALPGRPDIAITKYRIAIFCDGEFWHGKDWERKRPDIRSNRDYWMAKIERNINRDNEINRKLQHSGWLVMRFWGKDIQKNL
ncbi:MAG: very short patch repair endonuclease, partial [Synergistaceae bacterium]|nr:very short patch repair endonuclease [Synergistaceae bacterium]